MGGADDHFLRSKKFLPPTRALGDKRGRPGKRHDLEIEMLLRSLLF